MSGDAVVVAWVEDDPEVVGAAADLAERLQGTVWAATAGADPAALAAAGAERVLVLDPAGGVEAQAAALAELPTPRLFLVAGTVAGNDLAPRLAARLGAACFLDGARVLVVEGSAGELVVERWAYDDRAQERWLVPEGSPAVVALRPGSRGAPRPRPLRAEVARLGPLTASAHPRRRRRLPADPGSVRLAEAERIVAVGLGIGSRDLLPVVEELARRLSAAVGASRPLADRGWVPFERQIGTTGQQVSPRLYLAIGISGAPQHLGGVRAETVVAVNVDPACPMMTQATLAAVGDASQVVPALVRRLRERQGER
ncbi:MAG TPA: electron transfer flavoprotein subunit alpha/FixB family protein [Candidatus Dormibacteraeota bacterium]|nr:electron transfer flavoprotein subunit alpha/FixB family protein [Candidatus Dormibacteraeota bacterium]